MYLLLKSRCHFAQAAGARGAMNRLALRSRLGTSAVSRRDRLKILRKVVKKVSVDRSVCLNALALSEFWWGVWNFGISVCFWTRVVSTGQVGRAERTRAALPPGSGRARQCRNSDLKFRWNSVEIPHRQAAAAASAGDALEPVVSLYSAHGSVSPRPFQSFGWIL